MQHLIVGLLMASEAQIFGWGNQADERYALCARYVVACRASHRDCRVHMLSLVFVGVTLHTAGRIRVLSQRNGMFRSLRTNSQPSQAHNADNGEAHISVHLILKMSGLGIIAVL
jgi:hypothetical protein